MSLLYSLLQKRKVDGSAVSREDVMPRRIYDEAQDIGDLIKFIDLELAKAKGRNPEPDVIEVTFDRTSPTGRDRYTSETLDPIIEYFQALGWNFEQPGTVTICLQNGKSLYNPDEDKEVQLIALYFV